MSKYPLPSDDRLAQLIRDSFEYMPGPQMARLDQIEQRLKPALSRRAAGTKVNKIPWWIVLLLSGGIVTAAWWKEDIYRHIFGINDNTQNTTTIIEVDSVETTADPARYEPEEDMPDDVSNRDRSPIIYQREP